MFVLLVVYRKINRPAEIHNLCFFLVLSSGYCIPRDESQQDIPQKASLIDLYRFLNKNIFTTPLNIFWHNYKSRTIHKG